MQVQNSAPYLTVIGAVSQRLLTDETFRTTFFENPTDSLKAMQLDLAPAELAQLTTHIEAELAQLENRRALAVSLNVNIRGTWT